MVTSYCPDAAAAAELVPGSDAVRVFYDLDAPVTLARVDADLPVEWVGEGRYCRYAVVLSYSGGGGLNELKEKLGRGAWRRYTAAPILAFTVRCGRCERRRATGVSICRIWERGRRTGRRRSKGC